MRHEKVRRLAKAEEAGGNATMLDGQLFTRHSYKPLESVFPPLPRPGIKQFLPNAPYHHSPMCWPI